MKPGTARRLPRLGLAIAITLIGMSGVVSYRTSYQQAEAARWTSHTYEVVVTLQEIVSRLAAAESGVRGYALAKQDFFLVELNENVDHTQRAFQRTRVLVADNRQQEARLTKLGPLIQHRLRILRERLDAARRTGTPEEGVSIEGQHLSEDIRSIVATMISTEYGLLQRRSALMNEKAMYARATATLATALGVVFIVIAFFLLRNEMIERAKVEALAKTRHSLLNAILDGSHDSIFIKDIEGRYLMLNTAGAQQIGRPVHDVLGRDDRAVFPSDIAHAIMAADAQVMRTGEGITIEEDLPTTKGVRAYSVAKAPYRDDDGKIAGVIGIGRDISVTKNEEERRLREMNLLLQLGELLQACRTADEAYEVIGELAPQLFSETSGCVFLFHASRNLVEGRAKWGASSGVFEPPIFAPEECWGLRRGQPHFLESTTSGMVCKHVATPHPRSSFCLPMLAHGEMIGVLYLASATGLSEDVRRRAAVVGEQISMALANLYLRETLRNQSIRDPLTGLFNRRYTEETLEREVRRAARSNESLGVMMIDVDHFKSFNDTHGHEAGDQVLRELGGVLKNRTRGSDVASRMGGEEFVVVMPSANAEQTRMKAEQLREEVQKLDLRYGNVSLGQVTISVGFATYPEAGKLGADLLRAADAALYRSKHGGRNRVTAG